MINVRATFRRFNVDITIACVLYSFHSLLYIRTTKKLLLFFLRRGFSNIETSDNI